MIVRNTLGGLVLGLMPKILFPYHYGDTQIGRLSEILGKSGIDVRIRYYR